MSESILFSIVNILGFFINFALLACMNADKTNEYINKLPSVIRWILFPFFALIGLILCEAVVRFFTEGISIFWTNADTEFNTLITGYSLIPMLGMYGLCWGSYLMAPKFKNQVVTISGSTYLIWIIFVFVITDFSLTSDVIVERITQSENASTFSSVIAIIFYSLGLWMGIKSAKGNSFWSFID